MPAGRRAGSRSAGRSPSRASIRDWIAESRVRIEQARLLVLKTAWLMDTVGNKGAHTEIQAIKIADPGDGRVGHRQGDPGARRGGRQPGLPARRTCGPRARTLRLRRRARRGAQALAGPPRAARRYAAGRPPWPRARTSATGRDRHQQERRRRCRRTHSGSPSSPAARAGSARRVATRLAADGMAVAVLDLEEGACAATVDAITAAGGRALAVGADVSDADQVAGRGRRRSRPSSARRRCWSTTPA